ncbi:hypothetical protein Ciccas_007340 [Cichlidogyrus casuarinus]|uniref:Uncharacterized protein n=1 Tax=Cichlidogyrus casuarinus TaxID=1844966 RepID=A0ABD2Q3B8_9PLAT
MTCSLLPLQELKENTKQVLGKMKEICESLEEEIMELQQVATVSEAKNNSIAFLSEMRADLRYTHGQALNECIKQLMTCCILGQNSFDQTHTKEQIFRLCNKLVKVCDNLKESTRDLKHLPDWYEQNHLMALQSMLERNPVLGQKFALQLNQLKDCVIRLLAFLESTQVTNPILKSLLDFEKMIDSNAGNNAPQIIQDLINASFGESSLLKDSSKPPLLGLSMNQAMERSKTILTSCKASNDTFSQLDQNPTMIDPLMQNAVNLSVSLRSNAQPLLHCQAIGALIASMKSCASAADHVATISKYSVNTLIEEYPTCALNEEHCALLQEALNRIQHVLERSDVHCDETQQDMLNVEKQNCLLAAAQSLLENFGNLLDSTEIIANSINTDFGLEFTLKQAIDDGIESVNSLMANIDQAKLILYSQQLPQDITVEVMDGNRDQLSMSVQDTIQSNEDQLIYNYILPEDQSIDFTCYSLSKSLQEFMHEYQLSRDGDMVASGETGSRIPALVLDILSVVNPSKSLSNDELFARTQKYVNDFLWKICNINSLVTGLKALAHMPVQQGSSEETNLLQLCSAGQSQLAFCDTLLANGKEFLTRSRDLLSWAIHGPYGLKDQGFLGACDSAELLCHSARALSYSVPPQQSLDLLAEGYSKELNLPNQSVPNAQRLKNLYDQLLQVRV